MEQLFLELKAAEAAYNLNAFNKVQGKIMEKKLSGQTSPVPTPTPQVISPPIKAVTPLPVVNVDEKVRVVAKKTDQPIKE